MCTQTFGLGHGVATLVQNFAHYSRAAGMRLQAQAAGGWRAGTRQDVGEGFPFRFAFGARCHARGVGSTGDRRATRCGQCALADEMTMANVSSKP